jgi:hypothetical protein
VRAQVNIDVNMCAGTWAKSSTTAAQNSTLVSSTRSGRRSRSSASAACSSASATSKRGRRARGRTAQHAGARVLGAVDAVAEAHEALALAVEHALDVVAGVAVFSTLLDHAEHARRRTAVQRAGHRADRARQAAATSAPVEAMTRAVKVEAFMPCSAAETK